MREFQPLTCLVGKVSKRGGQCCQLFQKSRALRCFVDTWRLSLYYGKNVYTYSIANYVTCTTGNIHLCCGYSVHLHCPTCNFSVDNVYTCITCTAYSSTADSTSIFYVQHTLALRIVVVLVLPIANRRSFDCAKHDLEHWIPAVARIPAVLLATVRTQPPRQTEEMVFVHQWPPLWYEGYLWE